MTFMWRVRVGDVAGSQQYNILEESRVLFVLASLYHHNFTSLHVEFSCISNNLFITFLKLLSYMISKSGIFDVESDTIMVLGDLQTRISRTRS